MQDEAGGVTMSLQPMLHQRMWGQRGIDHRVRDTYFEGSDGASAEPALLDGARRGKLAWRTHGLTSIPTDPSLATI